MSLPSLSQTATRTASLPKDSLICLPKSTVRYLVQDLILGDGARQEVQKLDSIIQKKDKFIYMQDSLIQVKNRTISSCQLTIDSQEQIDDANRLTIESLNRSVRKYKRQRNVFKVIAGVFLLALVVK